MRTKVYSLDTQREDLYLQSLSAQRDDNSRDIEKMKNMLRNAMEYMLTDKQKKCITMYYFEHRNMNEIAKAMGVNKSTVSRHIKAASDNLKKLRAFIN